MLKLLKLTDIAGTADYGYSSFFQKSSVAHLSSIPFFHDVCEHIFMDGYDEQNLYGYAVYRFNTSQFRLPKGT